MNRLSGNHGWARVALIPSALGLSLLFASGCGGGATEGGLAPVHGRVTLNGGPWAKEGIIDFTPIMEKGAADPALFRPGSGRFTTDGRYNVESYEGAKGLYPGTYQVSVQCWEVEPGMDDKGKPTGKSYVPKKYQNGTTSGLTYKVEKGVPIEANFDVKSK